MKNTERSKSSMKQDLVCTRVFDAPVERVWQAWSDPEHVKRWWGPEGFSCPVARMDFREGGRSLVCMRAPKEFGGQDLYSTWTYTKIVPAREIEYLHHFADRDGNRVTPVTLGLPPDMPEEVRNAVTFKAVGNNETEITVTEFDWHAGQMMEMSRMGMEQCLDKMAASLAGI
ncbi:MAG: SRPBCC domain-containing protein [Terrimicrobiaceae bacterium]